MEQLREIYFYKDHFRKFYAKYDLKTRNKIKFILDIIRYEKYTPQRFFKQLHGTNGTYEIRISVKSGNIRLLSFFDNGNVIIIINCFMKKSRKVPLSEIKQASVLQKEYFSAKRI